LSYVNVMKIIHFVFHAHVEFNHGMINDYTRIDSNQYQIKCVCFIYFSFMIFFIYKIALLLV
jgi:hypothetical protein